MTIYLDNAATSFPKPSSVRRAVAESFDKYYANPGRSGHRAALETALAVYGVREKLAAFFGISNPQNAIFTCGATHAVNLAVFSAVKPNTDVITSTLEHNSVLRPLYHMEHLHGCRMHFIRQNSSHFVQELSQFIEKTNKNCSAVILTARSNVTGEALPIEKIGNICRQNGITLIVDASQSAGYESINMTKSCIDMLCIPSHKGLLGICGGGALLIGDNYKGEIKPLMYGGSGVFSADTHMPTGLPERLEAGTLPVSAILSMGAGIDFLNSYGTERANYNACRCADRARELLGNTKGITLYPSYGSIVLFNSDGVLPSKTAGHLDSHSIAVRSGLHCAPLCHGELGTLPHGAVRASFGAFNRLSHAEALVKVLKKGI